MVMIGKEAVQDRLILFSFFLVNRFVIEDKAMYKCRCYVYVMLWYVEDYAVML